MSKGYVYIMTSAIEGLIKIGKSKDWNRRCQSELESNGYKNANGLKTYFVVEVEDQEEIESIMHDIFRESRVSNFELFAVDKDRAKRVLAKMGNQVYPEINITNTNSSNSTYLELWNNFNNEVKKAKLSIKIKSSGYNKNYHVIVKNNIYFVISFKSNCIEIIIGSDTKDVYDKKVIPEIDTINTLSDLNFVDTSYTKSTGVATYRITAIQSFDINNYKNSDFKSIITKIEPIYKHMMN